MIRSAFRCPVRSFWVAYNKPSEGLLMHVTTLCEDHTCCSYRILLEDVHMSLCTWGPIPCKAVNDAAPHYYYTHIRFLDHMVTPKSSSYGLRKEGYDKWSPVRALHVAILLSNLSFNLQLGQAMREPD
ncbi:hypothetical protein VNO77_04073 [Canavalia gladiata]|uniref:Uncharacterized protein n=1 Tax=Canavalia gladiata TaxID=3824 RepID=A0AAN9MWK2_CANGL